MGRPRRAHPGAGDRRGGVADGGVPEDRFHARTPGAVANDQVPVPVRLWVSEPHFPNTLSADSFAVLGIPHAEVSAHGGRRSFYGCSYMLHLSGNDRRDSRCKGS